MGGSEGEAINAQCVSKRGTCSKVTGARNVCNSEMKWTDRHKEPNEQKKISERKNLF